MLYARSAMRAYHDNINILLPSELEDFLIFPAGFGNDPDFRLIFDLAQILILISLSKIFPDGRFYFFKILLHYPKKIFLILLTTLAIWLIVLIHIKLSFLAFNSNVPFVSIISIQPVVIFIGLLPITLAGIGTRESAAVLLFSGLTPAPTALAVGLIYSFVGQILITAFCLPFTYAVWNWKKPKV